MYAINRKIWSNVVSGLQGRPVFLRMEHFMTSSRLWAVIGLMFLLALIIVAIAAMAMLVLWVSTIDLSTMNPTQMIN